MEEFRIKWIIIWAPINLIIAIFLLWIFYNEIFEVFHLFFIILGLLPLICIFGLFSTYRMDSWGDLYEKNPKKYWIIMIIIDLVLISIIIFSFILKYIGIIEEPFEAKTIFIFSMVPFMIIFNSPGLILYLKWKKRYTN